MMMRQKTLWGNCIWGIGGEQLTIHLTRWNNSAVVIESIHNPETDTIKTTEPRWYTKYLKYIQSTFTGRDDTMDGHEVSIFHKIDFSTKRVERRNITEPTLVGRAPQDQPSGEVIRKKIWPDRMECRLECAYYINMRAAAKQTEIKHIDHDEPREPQIRVGYAQQDFNGSLAGKRARVLSVADQVRQRYAGERIY